MSTRSCSFEYKNNHNSSNITNTQHFSTPQNEYKNNPESRYYYNDHRIIKETIPYFPDSFSAISWNIRGFGSASQYTFGRKQSALTYFSQSLQPDIICIQEGRIQYKPTCSYDGVINDTASVQYAPPSLSNYFHSIQSTSLHDPYLKNVIYLHRKYENLVESLSVPHSFDVNHKEQDKHWIEWALIHPPSTPTIGLPTNPILIASYYRSPNRTTSLYDIQHIDDDLTYILSNNSVRIKYIIICGDFNIKHSTLCPLQFNHYRNVDFVEYERLIAILNKYNLEIINNDNNPTHCKGNKLDLIIASKELYNKQHSYHTLNIHCSDHFPLLSVFEGIKYLHYNNNALSNKKESKSDKVRVIRWNFKNPKNVSLFKENINRDIQQLYLKYLHLNKSEKVDTKIIDNIGFQYHHIFETNARKYIGIIKKTKYKYNKPWCTPEIAELSQTKHKMYRLYLSTGIVRYHCIWKRMRNQCKSLCKTAKKKYKESQLNKSRYNDQNLWRTYNNLKNEDKAQYDDIPFLCLNDKIKGRIKDNKIKSNILNSKFCHHSLDIQSIQYAPIQTMDFANIPALNIDIYPKNDVKAANYIKNPKLIKDYHFNSALNKLNRPITGRIIKYAFSTLKLNKNQGHGIHANLYDMVLNDILYFVKWMFQIFWINGHLPSIFKIEYIKPIHKDRRNPHSFDSYREISLTGTTRKLYEKSITIKIMEFIIDCNLINEYSMAALKGKSTTDAIAVITNDIYQGWSKYIPTYGLCSDISGCYPSVQYDIFIHRLICYYGITGLMINCISDLFQSVWAQTIVNSIGSLWMLKESGLGQGHTDSPLFNLLYLDPIFYVIQNPDLFRLMIYVAYYIILLMQ